MSNELTNIGQALEYQMSHLKDSKNRKVFDKVILGLNENSVKQFSRCLGVCYVKGASDFTDTMGKSNVPGHINSVVAFVVKGTDSARYDKAMEIADIILTCFRTDNNWIRLTNKNGNFTVRNTQISDFTTSLFPNGKRLDIACVFTLKHSICRR